MHKILCPYCCKKDIDPSHMVFRLSDPLHEENLEKKPVQHEAVVQSSVGENFFGNKEKTRSEGLSSKITRAEKDEGYVDDKLFKYYS